tara:strand:+ start:274 stop:462 length:189 start_codon:yes stop_codon:yes gene_type:complete
MNSIGGGTCGNCGKQGQKFIAFADGKKWGKCCKDEAPAPLKPRNKNPANFKNEGRPTIRFKI